MKSIFEIWRYRFSPKPSTYATLSFPPVTVLQPLFFQHLSARFRLTFLSALPSPASAMLRAILFAGRSLALKSVFFSVAAFALYTSPKPPPAPTTVGFAAATVGLLPVPPCPAATSTSVAASTTSSGSSRRALARGLLRACIVRLLSSLNWCSRRARGGPAPAALLDRGHGRGAMRLGPRRPASRRGSRRRRRRIASPSTARECAASASAASAPAPRSRSTWRLRARPRAMRRRSRPRRSARAG